MKPRKSVPKKNAKSKLAQKKCAPCDGGTPVLKGKALKDYTAELDGGWKVVKQRQLEKQFKFKNFVEALDFTNRVGKVAEKQGHHPDIFLTWGEVRLQIWTHSAGGLTESDFILAAKVDEL